MDDNHHGYIDIAVGVVYLVIALQMYTHGDKLDGYSYKLFLSVYTDGYSHTPITQMAAATNLDCRRIHPHT